MFEGTYDVFRGKGQFQFLHQLSAGSLLNFLTRLMFSVRCPIFCLRPISPIFCLRQKSMMKKPRRISYI